MKHNLKLTLILLSMFIVTQFIGLYVVNYYSPTQIVDGVHVNVSTPAQVPFIENPKIETEKEFYQIFPSIIVAFIIAIALMFFLTKIKSVIIIRLWFAFVVGLALTITITSFLPQLEYSKYIAIGIAIPLVFLKVFKRYFIIHNFTELLIYPGIASVFVPVLNTYTIIALLFAISIYDLWAVWKSGIMQKMAKHQISTLKIFAGFLVPSLTKEQRAKLKKMPKGKLKKKGMKVNMAILGGGDVIFPIITAGVFLKVYGWSPAILTIIGATCGLSYIFFFGKEKKAYPAMPFITTGILAGLAVWWAFF